MRKSFKSKIVFLAIAAVAAIGIGSAGAATASAASCNVSRDATQRYVDGGYQVMGFQAHIKNCSQVSAVRWVYSPSGFNDATETGLCCVPHQAYLVGGTSDYTLNNPGSTDHAALVSQTCWYTGLHVQWPFFSYQIKNSVTGTWGSVHTYQATSADNVTC